MRRTDDRRSSRKPSTPTASVSNHSAARITRRDRRTAARRRLNAAAHRQYERCAELAGPLTAPDGAHSPVKFRPVVRPMQRLALTLLVLANGATGCLFVGWLMLPQHVPGPGVVGPGSWQLVTARVAFCCVVLVEVVRLVQNVAVWTFALRARDPVPYIAKPGLRVAMLTTIVPAKEPLDVLERTLWAMKQVRYAGTVDIWILDEGNDPKVRAMAQRLGVHHFSRHGRPEFNQPSGPFRARTKAGNHNAWRAVHEYRYDVVAQMDPDHVPLPSFLERTLGYFRDPDVAFVVAPQVYGNMYSGWVVHGASAQQYLFSGIIERGGNGLAAPLLIGTNHLYRPLAWALIDGYQDSIIEDHLTGMCVQGATNPVTGRRWKGVYTPDVVAIGEGPTSWTDYFNQQKRWAYGVWEIVLRRGRTHLRRLTSRQRLCYGLVQSYYPSVALAVVCGNAATATYLGLGIGSTQLDGHLWLALWAASMTTWFLLWLWLRRFNVARHERRELGVHGMLLALFAAPVYVAAAVAALLRRPLAYTVTAKGRLRSVDSPRSFVVHVCWALAAAALLATSAVFGHDSIALRLWASLSVLAGTGPPVVAFCTWLRGRAARQSTDAVPASLPLVLSPPPTMVLRPAVPAPRMPMPEEIGLFGATP